MKGDLSVETNELSKGASGGTEMMLRRIHRELDPDLLDKVQIIPTRVRELDPGKKKILWVHDTFRDPEVRHLADPRSRSRFDAIVFVSNHQRSLCCEVLNLPYSDTYVINNAVEAFPPYKPRAREPVRFIYHTTPHRGLEILVPAFAKLAEDWNVHLDVFSSFEIYGWPQRDAPYATLLGVCDEHPMITNHGFQSNEVVREALTNVHAFVYPSIWMETSCIAAIEALCAGCNVICPDYGALPETIGPFGWTYNFVEDRNHHEGFLLSTLEDYVNEIVDTEPHEVYQRAMAQQAHICGEWYSLDDALGDWDNLLRGLL